MKNPPRELFPYFQVSEDLACVTDVRDLFPQSLPVEMDIGCARGVFLTRAALQNPQRNFVGLELDFSKARVAAKKLCKREMPNARILGGDCRLFLRNHVVSGTIDVAHVYFPDPWWKRRHKKRRLFTPEFCGLLSQTVRSGGLVNSWTDVEEYFEVISALMSHHADFEVVGEHGRIDPDEDREFLTGFDRKKSLAGGHVWRGQWCRR